MPFSPTATRSTTNGPSLAMRSRICSSVARVRSSETAKSGELAKTSPARSMVQAHWMCRAQVPTRLTVPRAVVISRRGPKCSVNISAARPAPLSSNPFRAERRCMICSRVVAISDAPVKQILGAFHKSVVIHFVIVLYVIMELSCLLLTQSKGLDHRPELLVLCLIIAWSTIAGRKFLFVNDRCDFAVFERLSVISQ
ncbi:protein of unknown function [Caballeronia sp. S22]